MDGIGQCITLSWVTAIFINQTRWQSAEDSKDTGQSFICLWTCYLFILNDLFAAGLLCQGSLTTPDMAYALLSEKNPVIAGLGKAVMLSFWSF